MRHCEKCGVDFTGDLDRCPLCQAELSGTAVPSAFPRNKVKTSGTVALAVLAFVTGACLLLALFFGHVFALQGGIVLSICLALAANYLFVRNIILHRPDFLRSVVRYFLLLLALAAILFLVTGNTAVTTFVIPGICLVALVFDTVLLAVFRSTFVARYAKYLLFHVLFGLAPLVLVALGLTTVELPALISALAASVFFLGLVVFMHRQLIAELRKLFSA